MDYWWIGRFEFSKRKIANELTREVTMHSWQFGSFPMPNYEFLHTLIDAQKLQETYDVLFHFLNFGDFRERSIALKMLPRMPHSPPRFPHPLDEVCNRFSLAMGISKDTEGKGRVLMLYRELFGQFNHAIAVEHLFREILPKGDTVQIGQFQASLNQVELNDILPLMSVILSFELWELASLLARLESLRREEVEAAKKLIGKLLTLKVSGAIREMFFDYPGNFQGRSSSWRKERIAEQLVRYRYMVEGVLGAETYADLLSLSARRG